MTGKELVEFCYSKIGTAYVYGMKGKVMTQNDFSRLYKTYGERYVPKEDKKKIGKICVDCSGLISWACDRWMNSDSWYQKANLRKPISTIKEAPIGALAWRKGHIGVYIGLIDGEPHYIAADNSWHGTRKAPLRVNNFSHWLLVESIFTYEENGEMVTKDTIIVDGEKHEVDMIRKDGVTYIKTRDIAGLVGYKIGNQGKIPVLTKE